MSLPWVVVGESLVDIVVPRTGAPSCAVGGSPLNVAVGLARLDVETLLVTQVGDDEHGGRITAHLEASGVRLSEGSVVPGRRTSTATARLDEASAALYDFDLTWDLESQPLPSGRAMHVGSLGAFLEPGRAAVVDMLRAAAEAGWFLSYDPNMRPAFVPDPLQAWHQVCEVAALCPLVKMSVEDVVLLRPDLAPQGTAQDSGIARKAAAHAAGELLEQGEATEMVIVTRGGDGADAYLSGCEMSVTAPRVEVVDTVGAGDSFMAATLAILDDWSLPATGPGALDALDSDRIRILLSGAAEVAALTCQQRGANPPQRRQLPAVWPRYET